MASGYSDLSEIRKAGQPYGSHQRPPKINLLNERPRRESLVEQHLATRLDKLDFESGTAQQMRGEDLSQLVNDSRYHVHESHQTTTSINFEPLEIDSLGSEISRSGGRQPGFFAAAGEASSAPEQQWRHQNPNQQQQQQQQQQRHQRIPMSQSETERTQAANSISQYSELVNDLAKKEAKLRKELAYMNLHLANPWARPPQVRSPRREPEPRVAKNKQGWVKEIPPESTSPRPTSRASSTRSTTEADLMEKTEQLLKDVQELERKPLKTQQVLIESGASRASKSSSSFDRAPKLVPSSSSIHTAVIKVPINEPDNKSPLPFAFDNFSTLGVRGNIASVGAAEPDTPYPPIYPVVKRTPSPRC